MNARALFLQADDAGAEKTTMAGLLIRKLRLRGLAERILIVAPSNPAFQWQRELQELFDETYAVPKESELRAQLDVNQWIQQPKAVTSLEFPTPSPHMGDPENFSIFIQLLDRDVYAHVRSIRRAIDAGRAVDPNAIVDLQGTT